MNFRTLLYGNRQEENAAPVVTAGRPEKELRGNDDPDLHPRQPGSSPAEDPPRKAVEAVISVARRRPRSRKASVRQISMSGPGPQIARAGLEMQRDMQTFGAGPMANAARVHSRRR